jgi:hypothetical protein
MDQQKLSLTLKDTKACGHLYGTKLHIVTDLHRGIFQNVWRDGGDAGKNRAITA